MTLSLVYSRAHVCHNKSMIWQPAGHHFYCAVCHSKEAPNEYAPSTFDTQLLPTEPATA